MIEKKNTGKKLSNEGIYTDSLEVFFGQADDLSLPALEDEPVAPPRISAKKSQKKKKSSAFLHGLKVFFIVLSVLVLLLAAAITYGGYYVSSLDTTLPNLYIDGIFVGRMTEAQVDSALINAGWDEKVDEDLLVKLPHDISFTVRYLEAGVRTPRENAVAAVCAYGHTDNWFINLHNYLNNLLNSERISTISEINEDYIRSCISAGAEALAEHTADNGYTIDKEKSLIIFLKGAGEMTLDEEALFTEIADAIRYDQPEISFSRLKGNCTKPDFEALFEKLAVDTQDAYYTDDFRVVDEVDGFWFDVAMANKLWSSAEPLSVVKLPVTITYPDVTGDDLRGLLYRDLLGEGTTYFAKSNENRISNIQLAASKLDGTIMLPGDIFSYNNCIGKRTEDAGFLPAGAYESGRLVQEVGGGICQVSSTLYSATLFAGMETLSRTSHFYEVDYMPRGMDATVSWPKPDFEFKNPLEFPIKIVTYCDPEEKYITVQVWGTKTDDTYIEFRHQTYVRYDSEIADAIIGYYVLGFRDYYDSGGNLIKTVAEPPSDYFVLGYAS